jgi:hypothetical protein
MDKGDGKPICIVGCTQPLQQGVQRVTAEFARGCIISLSDQAAMRAAFGRATKKE